MTTANVTTTGSEAEKASAAATRRVLSIEEVLEARPELDNSEVFGQLAGIMRELRQKMLDSFELTPSPANAKYGSYTPPNGACKGSLNTFHGPEIEWLVDSWMGNPASGFTNMHFNTWLRADTRVPHLAIVLGTIPDVFFYFDFVPRTDLTTDVDYLDRYYEWLNAKFIAFHEDPAMKPFISRSNYMRQAISPSGLCFTCSRDPRNVALLRATAHALMDQWIAWVKAGDPVLAKEEAGLAARDQRVRRAIAERDPANSLAERLLGKTEMETLVKLLWGVQPDHE